MKKIFFRPILLTLVLICGPVSSFSQWKKLGVIYEPLGASGDPSFAFHPVSGEPYVAYGAGTDSLSVRYFNGGVWKQLGQFNVKKNSGCQIVFNPLTNEPYIAYTDLNDSFYTVKHFNGSSWIPAGFDIEGIDSLGYAPFITFRKGTDELYICVADETINSYRVKKLNGNNWIDLGDPVGNLSSAAPVLAVNPINGEVFISYTDLVSSKFITEKYNGTSWVRAGYVTGDTKNKQALTFDNDNVLCVAYSDFISEKLVIKSMTDTAWKEMASISFYSYLSSPAFAFHPVSNILHISYLNSIEGKFTVKKFEDNEWKDIGEALSSNGYFSNTPVISFQPVTNKLHIAYYDKTSHFCEVARYDEILAGIETVEKGQFNLYPNPVSQGEAINIKGPSLRQNCLYEVMTISGQVVFKGSVKENNIDISGSVFENTGIYFIRIYDKNISETIKLLVL